MGKITLRFAEARDTKNTIRFEEEVNGDLEVAKIGNIYISKSALKELGWNRGGSLYIQISTTPNME